MNGILKEMRDKTTELLNPHQHGHPVALKRFIDDMAVEVIEAKLMSALDRILLPVSIYKMLDDQAARIAGESDEIRTEREQLNKQLEVLPEWFRNVQAHSKEPDSLDSIINSRDGGEHTPGANSDAELELPSVSSISQPSELVYDSTLGPNTELVSAEIEEGVQEASHTMVAIFLPWLMKSRT
ncbi:hypothetical protein NEMBOFW57_006227 [Staphylotrichum longicolle]|uniref:GED domain-containing protein n=1 Tax=Staphylotrichum longicolle TaxID=669026 RepID=A0AAD4EZ89_9PEZI|nr:hypothetical protein NEMBOFW57_006227 [Staphylotrichum longicolle]